MKIKPEKLYTPTEIARSKKIMTASSIDTRRQMLLRAIRNKKIEAINVGGEKKPRYVIQGKNLISYLNSQVKPGSYTKK